MNQLQILLVENDGQKAEQVIARLPCDDYSVMTVPDLEEAAEALNIQKFDALLLGSAQEAGRITAFAAGLREAEAAQRSESRAAVVSCSPEVSESAALDGVLPVGFSPAQLTEELSRIRKHASLNGLAWSSLLIFQPEQFEEQCANETELMIEILDLFDEERAREIPAMEAALSSGDFERLSRIAHSMKGSLGSLHAPAAREKAQELEMAARSGDAGLSTRVLGALRHDLDPLAEQLAAFRQVCLTR